jgi:Transposase IS200 like
MGYPRSRTVDHSLCSVYHCVSRCVRREFLLADAVRAAWIDQRLEFLSSLFAVDVLEYAIMENHLHLLLRIRPELAWCWSDTEVAERWLTLRAAGPLGRAGDWSGRPSPEEVAEAASDEADIDEWRRRLANLGWFHKELKEPCARMWNAEEHRAGHFWEGRYSSKVALDDVAVTVQAFYVLLNLVRAGAESGTGRRRLLPFVERTPSIPPDGVAAALESPYTAPPTR